jgi:hypothetical protein
MASPSRAHDDGAAEACLEGTSSSGRRSLPGAGSQRAPQQGSREPGAAYHTGWTPGPAAPRSVRCHAARCVPRTKRQNPTASATFIETK